MTDSVPDSLLRARDGQVVTFYSFKGGTGRTMALANVAWILAANGRRVLVADWDLESPGLHKYFHPFLGERDLADSRGIIDLIREYQRAAARGDAEARPAICEELARVERFAVSLQWDFPHGGCLDFLSPGKLNRDYSAMLSGVEWDNFYDELGGGQFLDALRADMKGGYDYALIDSRTGFSDIADICTLHLPDVLVDCFALSGQALEGAARVAAFIRERHADRGIRVLPVPMRVDPAEKKKVDDSRLVAMRHFPGFPASMSDGERREYWAGVEIPYQAFYAFEEALAVFGDKPGSPTSLLAAFERLTGYITQDAVTSLPPMDEQFRLRWADRFIRTAPLAGDVIEVESLPQDQAWAEWISAVLAGEGIEVRQHRIDAEAAAPGTVPDGSEPRFSRRLVVVSSAYLERDRRGRIADAPDVAAYVVPTSALRGPRAGATLALSGLSEEEAVTQLRRVLGLSGRPAESQVARTRFPGHEPRIFDRVPARNVRFTGREGDIGQLRELLRERPGGRALPVVLHGLGGVGKTQMAIEWVHRFRTDYDLIYWVDCEEPAYIDGFLADLGAQLRTVFGMSLPPSANSPELARLVIDALSRTELSWLLVFDNANDVELVLPYVPQSGGHVITTSSNRSWPEQSMSLLPLDVFTREESIEHLRRRVPAIERAEADEIAAVVGDLPLFVALTGAWLAETDFAVSDFVMRLQGQPRQTLTELNKAIGTTWDVSLSRLAERSAAAVRLFELCSVMATRISLNLIYSPEMVGLLHPLDDQLTEQIQIGGVVQEISRLALIKLDSGLHQIAVHQVVQEAVRDRIHPDRLEQTRQEALSLLVAGRPRREVDDPETWQRYRMIWPHLEPLRAMTSEREAVRQLLIDRVRYLSLRTDLERGRELAVEVESCWQAMEAAQTDTEAARTLHRQLLQLRFNLGNILRAQGAYDQARVLNEQVWTEQRELLPVDHPHTLMTAGSLGADLRAAGRYQEALAMDRRTYATWTEKFGEDHPRALMAAHNLAVSLRLTGAVNEAMRRNAATYDRRRATTGPGDPRTLGSAINIGRNLIDAGEYSEAVTQMQEVHRIAEAELGPDTVEARMAQVQLGIALRSAGRLAEAEEPFRAALAMLSRRFGESSREALACRLSRALNTMSQDRFAEALPDIRQVLAAYQERFGSRHPLTLACWLNLAAAFRFAGEHGEATRAIRAAADGFAEVLGEQHPYTLAARTNIGVLTADEGDLARAEALEARTAAALSEVLWPDHPDTLRCQANLLLTRHELGDHAALGQRLAVVGELAAMLGEQHPTVTTLRADRRLLRTLDPQPF